jgi:hypothetical protein
VLAKSRHAAWVRSRIVRSSASCRRAKLWVPETARSSSSPVEPRIRAEAKRTLTGYFKKLGGLGPSMQAQDRGGEAGGLLLGDVVTGVDGAELDQVGEVALVLGPGAG